MATPAIGGCARLASRWSGLGGVGSWAVEALARSGVAALTLIDLDHVAESNINRQLQATTQHARHGQAAGAAASASPTSIPACTVHGVEAFVEPDNWPQLLPAPRRRRHRRLRPGARQGGASPRGRCAARVALVCTGAAGGKRAAQRVEVADLAEVTHDPLLAALRQRLRKAGAPRSGAIGVRCVFSREAVLRPDAAGCAIGDDEPVDGSLNCHGYGSSVAVTATFGMVAAGELMQLASARGRDARRRAGACGAVIESRGSTPGVVSSVGRAADF